MQHVRGKAMTLELEGGRLPPRAMARRQHWQTARGLRHHVQGDGGTKEGAHVRREGVSGNVTFAKLGAQAAFPYTATSLWSTKKILCKHPSSDP